MSETKTSEDKLPYNLSNNADDIRDGVAIDITAGSQALHRALRGKEVQLFAIGGAIGTCKLSESTTHQQRY